MCFNYKLEKTYFILVQIIETRANTSNIETRVWPAFRAGMCAGSRATRVWMMRKRGDGLDQVSYDSEPPVNTFSTIGKMENARAHSR